MARIASEYKFNHSEVVQLMLQDAGIHDGLWMLVVHFSMVGGNLGPTPDTVMPSAIVGIQSFGIMRADQPGPMVFDASELNPAK